jgi:L-threonylcarbamoyladenylate synthase
MTIITKDISFAIHTLNEGKVVAIPTETVYGLAANIHNETAVKKIFEIKKRPNNNPLIVHLKSTEQLKEVAKKIPPLATQLAAQFWPGSLTLVLKKQDCISDWVTSGKNTVAVRVPNHHLTLELLNQLNFPLAAPSANPFGSISPTNAQHVFDYFKNDIDVVLDGGSCQNGIESTIIGFEGEKPVLYRYGAIPIEEIEKIVGPIKVCNKDTIAPSAPGMFTKHYAPKTKSFLVEDIEKELESISSEKIGVLQFQNKTKTSKPVIQYILSPTGDFKEASKNLYSYLHELDALGLDVLLIEKLPNINLGKSINDRLNRAVAEL